MEISINNFGCGKETSDPHACANCGNLRCSDAEKNGDEILCHLCTRESKITYEREASGKGIQVGADKMVALSRKKFSDVAIGTHVTIPVPKFDRGPLDSNNISGIISDFRNGVYQISTSVGTLKNWYTRTEFRVSKTKLIGEVCTDVVSVREAVTKLSGFGGQGYQKCTCKPGKNQCRTAKCKCFRSKVVCNSRCHSSLTCCNK